ncbi:hypothetical protein AB0Y53_21650 [Parabacteroides distasonis]|uniref:hypothetical protein n=1 Tax=Parabacteroides distasonis TaxID=823 RepID=UPI003F282E02
MKKDTPKVNPIKFTEEDYFRLLQTVVMTNTFIGSLSAGFQGKERLEKITKIAENMFVLNRLMESAESNGEDWGDEMLLDSLYTESEVLVTKYKHLLSEDQLESINNSIKNFAESAEKARKEAYEEKVAQAEVIDFEKAKKKRGK